MQTISVEKHWIQPPWIRGAQAGRCLGWFCCLLGWQGMWLLLGWSFNRSGSQGAWTAFEEFVIPVIKHPDPTHGWDVGTSPISIKTHHLNSTCLSQLGSLLWAASRSRTLFCCMQASCICLSFHRASKREQGDSGIPHGFITKHRKQVFAAMQRYNNQWFFESPVWLRAFHITAKSGRKGAGRSQVLHLFEKWHLPGTCCLHYLEILWKQRLLFQVGTDHIDAGVQQVPDRSPQQLSG